MDGSVLILIPLILLLAELPLQHPQLQQHPQKDPTNAALCLMLLTEERIPERVILPIIVAATYQEHLPLEMCRASNA